MLVLFGVILQSVVTTKRTPLRTPRSTRRAARGPNKPDIPPQMAEPIVIQGEEATPAKGSNSKKNDVTNKDTSDVKSPKNKSSDDEKKVFCNYVSLI